MNLLLAIFLIVFEAVSEGLQTGGHLLAAELVEFVYLAGITLGLLMWLNWRQVNSFYDRSKLIKVIIGYILLRFALFDLVWNISAGQDLFFYGTTKVYDRFMSSLGSWGWMWKGISLIWGIAWLTEWGNK